MSPSIPVWPYDQPTTVHDEQLTSPSQASRGPTGPDPEPTQILPSRNQTCMIEDDETSLSQKYPLRGLSGSITVPGLIYLDVRSLDADPQQRISDALSFGGQSHGIPLSSDPFEERKG